MTNKGLKNLTYDISKHINMLTRIGENFSCTMNEGHPITTFAFTYYKYEFTCKHNQLAYTGVINCKDTKTGITYKLSDQDHTNALLLAIRNNKNKLVDLDYQD